MPFYRQAKPLLLVAVTFSLVHTPLQACSTCKCGDPTLTLVGSEKPFAGRLRLGVDYQLRSETEGDPDVLESEIDEERLTLGIIYSVNRRLTLGLRVPYVWKEQQTNTLARNEARGLGDSDIFARYNLWERERDIYGITVGARLPTADEAEDQNGDPVDIDAQPDVAAPAALIGGYWQRFLHPWFYTASATATLYGDGRQGIEPGNNITGSLRAQYAFSYGLAAQAGLDFRYGERDAFDGIDDEDSGGFLGNLFVGGAWSPVEDWLMFAGVQVPLLDDLNGHQDEDPTFQLGVIADFQLPVGKD